MGRFVDLREFVSGYNPADFVPAGSPQRIVNLSEFAQKPQTVGLVDVGEPPTQEMIAEKPSVLLDTGARLGERVQEIAEEVFPYRKPEGEGLRERKRLARVPEISEAMGVLPEKITGGLGRIGAGIVGWHADLLTNPVKAIADMMASIKCGALKWKQLEDAIKGNEEFRYALAKEIDDYPVETVAEFFMPIGAVLGLKGLIGKPIPKLRVRGKGIKIQPKETTYAETIPGHKEVVPGGAPEGIREAGAETRGADIQRIEEAGGEAGRQALMQREEAPEIPVKELVPSPYESAMPKALEPAVPGEIVSPRDIVRSFEDNFNAVIRTGHMGPTEALGIFKVGPEVIRAKKALNIPVLSHELAHHIDKQFGIRKFFKKNQELVKLDYDYPKKSRVSEGFAEYMRLWLTGHDAMKFAPNFSVEWQKFLTERPNLLAALESSKALIDRYRQEGSVDRLWSRIDMEGKAGKLPLRERFGQLKRQMLRLWTDEHHVLEWAEKEIRGVKKLDPMEIDPNTSPTMIVRSVSKTAGAKAQRMVLSETFDWAGEKTGISLREAMAPVTTTEELKNVTVYAFAKHALEVAERGIDVGADLVDARYAVEKLYSPVRDKIATDVAQWNNRLLDYLVEAGGLDPAARNLMVDLNPYYIALKRVFENFAPGRGLPPRKLGSLGQPIKRLKGGGQMIRNPWQAMIEQAAQIIGTADKIRVGKALVNLAQKTPGGGRWVESIPPEKYVMSATLETLQRQLEAAGVDFANLPDVDMQGILTIYGNKPFYFGKDNIVTFWDKKRRWFELDPELYKSIMATDVPQRPLLYTIFSAPRRAVRMGATALQPGFAWATNPLRDAPVFALQTEYGNAMRGSTAHARGLRLKFTNDELYQLFVRSGADMSNSLGLDKRGIKIAMDALLANTQKAKAMNVVHHPIEVFKEILSVGESAPRIAEFADAYRILEQKWGKRSASARIGASLAASDVTVNFRRQGVYASVLNDFIPFFTASIQGPARMARFIREHPTKAVVRGMAMITAPTIALWYVNRDREWYRNLPTWQKYGCFNFEVGDNIVRLPRPFEWGYIFGSLPEAFLNRWYEDNPWEFNKAITYMTDQSSPDFLPSLVSPLIEIATNYDFFRERPIVGEYEKLKPPELQYREWTPETYKILSKAFGYIPGSPELSPLEIEHLIEAYSGGLAGDVVWAAEGIAKGIKFDTPADYPIVGRLFGRKEKPEARESRIGAERSEKLIRIRALYRDGQTERAEDERQEWNRIYPENQITSRQMRTKPKVKK